uniref:Uncharacterized protein n=1 Tax=Glossina pallidipes TaxID=7398 RepID=A0A1A9Z991_GLOPL
MYKLTVECGMSITLVIAFLIFNDKRHRSYRRCIYCICTCCLLRQIKVDMLVHKFSKFTTTDFPNISYLREKTKTLPTIPVKAFDSNIETRQLLNFNYSATTRITTTTAIKTPVIDDE